MSEPQDKQPQQVPTPQPLGNAQPQSQQQPRESPRSHSHSHSHSHSNDSYQSDSFSGHSSLQESQKQMDKIDEQGGDTNKGTMGQGEGKNQGNHGADRKIRYKYCCKVCKHTDKSKKACVCVVPKNQRRTQIGEQGCQTCGCIGCSKQDFISRGEDPEYRPGQKSKKAKKQAQKQSQQFEARNGCCRKCMKAFSKTNKSCLCQVPQDVRNTKLPGSGCKICGCFGCNPEDKKQQKNRKTSKRQKQRERDRDRSREKRKRTYKSQSSESNPFQNSDKTELNFYNVDKSIIGGMMINQLRIDPALIGFGIPQRTYSYITGKPK